MKLRFVSLVVALSASAACRRPTGASPARSSATAPASPAPDARPTVIAPSSTRVPGTVTVTGPEAHVLIEHGAHLVDVRSELEFHQGHLPGAVNIPVEHVWQRYGEIALGPIVVYSNGGTDNRSARARRILGAFGRQAVDLGAMSNW